VSAPCRAHQNEGQACVYPFTTTAGNSGGKTIAVGREQWEAKKQTPSARCKPRNLAICAPVYGAIFVEGSPAALAKGADGADAEPVAGAAR
jgi:hypothetical protein